MKEWIAKQLKKKVQALLAEHKPIIIAVSGSVGKTSARNAIASVLDGKFTVRKTIENYNNELGVPLTILGAVSPGRNILGWLRILSLRPKSLPQVFVLEYAIDRPGDMQYLCEIAKPDIVVMTRISPVHAEFFASIEELAKEKGVLLECVKKDGLAIVNADDPRVMELKERAAAEVTTYGFVDAADVQAKDYALAVREDFSFEPGETFSTTHVRVDDGEQELDVALNNVIGKASVSSVLPAIVVAEHLGMRVDEILARLPEITFEPGRMNPLPGIKGSLIIDSSYNAAPASMVAALQVLGEFSPENEARRIAVLGHMAELGQYTEQEHRMIGLRAAEEGVDVLVTVGEMARDIRRGAIEGGVEESNCEHFNDSTEAGRWLDAQVKKGDIMLVKGSQSARMERVVKDIMAEPLQARALLVRQSDKWLA